MEKQTEISIDEIKMSEGKSELYILNHKGVYIMDIMNIDMPYIEIELPKPQQGVSTYYGTITLPKLMTPYYQFGHYYMNEFISEYAVVFMLTPYIVKFSSKFAI